MYIAFGKSMNPTNFPPALDKQYNRMVLYGVACGVMVIVIGNGHGNTSSNPGRDWLHFT